MWERGKGGADECGILSGPPSYPVVSSSFAGLDGEGCVEPFSYSLTQWYFLQLSRPVLSLKRDRANPSLCWTFTA